MEKFGDDVLGKILEKITGCHDRTSFSEVCRQWARVEGLSRTSIRVLEPDQSPNFLQRFPNLISLEINTTFSDGNLESIAELCPNLRTLNLSMRGRDWRRRWGLPDFGVSGLRAAAVKCRFLTKVFLRRREQLTDAAVIALVSNSGKLTVLDLSRCSRITDNALSALGSMGSLEELYLKGCSMITNESLVSLATGLPSKSLRKLDLTECDRITDISTYLMPQMHCLEELCLAECGPEITDEGGLVISRISSISILDFSWLFNITDVTVVAVAENCLNLVGIKLTGCEFVTGQAIRAFAGHESLEMIGIHWCNLICASDVEEILLRCPSLRHLELNAILRGLMSSSADEKLSTLHKVEWL